MMETILRKERPTAKQLYLDPRTKILLCLTVTFVMLSSDGMGIMRYIQPCTAAAGTPSDFIEEAVDRGLLCGNLSFCSSFSVFVYAASASVS